MLEIKQNYFNYWLKTFCGKLRLPDPNLSWFEQMNSFAMEYRATLLSIRDSAEVLLEAPPLTPKRLFLVESMFKIFVNAGFPPKDVVMASMLINDYILSFVKNEMIMSNMALSQGISTQEAKNNSKNFFSSLPTDQFPTIISLADYMAFENMDDHFEFGIQTLLSSLKERLNNK
jgi:TetR/AcrR family transcriptional regulator, tetracycline repressor protein